MDNFTLRRTDAARFLAQTQMGWFSCWNREPEGCRLSSWLNVICTGKRRCSEAASFPERGLPPPTLKHREHGKDHLSAEADRSGGQFEGGKLIPERSTEHST
jgi:hypothetical protein